MIEETIKERENNYGDFEDNGRIAQDLKGVMRDDDGWVRLRPYQKEALDMIMSKVSRCICGSGDFEDTWVDIQGYAARTQQLNDRRQEPEPDCMGDRIMSYSLFNHHNYLVGKSEREMCAMYQEYLNRIEDEAQPKPNEDSVPEEPLSLSQWAQSQGFSWESDNWHSDTGIVSQETMQNMYQKYLSTNPTTYAF